MGWKGAVRSIGAAVRAAERDAKRRQRELEKRQRQYTKHQSTWPIMEECIIKKLHLVKARELM